MENIITALLFGLAGAAAGFMLPALSQKITYYKCLKKNTKPVLDKLFKSGLIKWAACLLNTFLWAFAGYNAQSLAGAVLIAVLSYISLLITIIDIQIRIIPNELVLAMVAAGALFQLVNFGASALMPALLTMLAMMIFFTAVAAMVGFGKVGAGDVKLAGAMGLALGFSGVITALAVMSIVLIAFTLIGLAAKRLKLKSMVPFAPFMMCGMVFALACTALGIGLI